MPAEIFKEVIKFIYTGQVDVADTDENELIKAATKYEIKPLVGHVQLRRNLRHSPLAVKELDNLKHKFDEASYLYEKSKERLSIRNPFNDSPNRYYWEFDSYLFTLTNVRYQIERENKII